MSKTKTVSASSLSYTSNMERPETNLVTLEIKNLKHVHSVKKTQSNPIQFTTS